MLYYCRSKVLERKISIRAVITFKKFKLVKYEMPYILPLF